MRHKPNAKTLPERGTAGRPKGRTKVKTNMTLDVEVLADARTAAQALNIALSAKINDLLDEWLVSDEVATVREAVEANRKIRAARAVAKSKADAKGGANK